MSMVFNTLRRMESKIDGLTLPLPVTTIEHGAINGRTTSLSQVESPVQTDSVLSVQSPSSLLSVIKHIRHVSTNQLELSFSAHRTVHWPGVQALLPPDLATTVSKLERSYPTHLESARPALPPQISAQETTSAVDWLASLSVTCVKDLSNAYFDTFNRVHPFLDPSFYFASTLADVVQHGFDYNIESCLVLNVMALGCMGLKAFGEGGFNVSLDVSISPIISLVLDEETPGLSFFNEARRRMGFCLCDHDVQAAQYYLTSSIFYAQTMRPMDMWMMLNRAATVSKAYWQCPPESIAPWLADMQSRLFWSTLSMESLVVQELEVPEAGLKAWEDQVLLPKFMPYPHGQHTRQQASDDSFFHYHFLAQIAQRIILNRIRDELFNNNPSTKLAEELRHQLEQWRANLPAALQFDDDSHDQSFSAPAEAVAVALLQMRYRVAIFHLGRPFLYKAIHNPAALSEVDLKLCAEALVHAMDWHLTLDVCVRMKDFAPLKYFCCGQFFGQLLIFHAFKNSSSHRLRDALPTGYEDWCTMMLRFIYEHADGSPTVTKDFELLSGLYHVANS
jgi:hypothetical protein